MEWSDERPTWLPPIPPPHRGRARIVAGMLLVTAVMIVVLVTAFVGGTISVYLWWPLAGGLLLLGSGLLSRRRLP